MLLKTAAPSAFPAGLYISYSMPHKGKDDRTMNLSAASSRQPNPLRRHTLYLKDPASAISHFIGAIGFAGAGIPLLIKAGQSGQPLALVSMIVYAVSLVALYAASAAYHTISPRSPRETLLKKIDHMMIFVLIAGSYTPVCLLALPRLSGLVLLGVIWGCTLLGACSMFFFVFCPKWVSSVLYIAMGWACVFALPQLLGCLSGACFGWLLAGGLLYTAGGVIYALKRPEFERRHPNFGMHEIFHLFVMAGSLCHYIVMYVYLLG